MIISIKGYSTSAPSNPYYLSTVYANDFLFVGIIFPNIYLSNISDKKVNKAPLGIY